jgi:hypothetical protein
MARLADGKVVSRSSGDMRDRVVAGVGVGVTRELGNDLVLLRHGREAYLRTSQ